MVKFAFQRYDRKFEKPLITAHGEWSVRSGLLIALTDINGVMRLGEIAPLPWFGTETLEEAIEFCTSLGDEFDQLTVPEKLPCCQFAFEMAQSSLAPLNLIVPLHKRDLGGSIAGLLSSGSNALSQWQNLYETGTRSFKWKIGVTDIESELIIFQQLCQVLPNDVKLRLDANAGLTFIQAKQWLEICDQINQIEYLEQPLDIHEFEAMLELSQSYKTPIALDESIATYTQLEDCYHRGWRGIFVVKPTIAGQPSRLREFCKTRSLDLVFSSVFETPIGRTAGLQIAQEVGTNRALGYGTDRFFDQTITPAMGILESDPGKFLVKFWQARVENRSMFLGNPLWGRSDLEQLDKLIKSHHSNQPYIYIPTGGTSGKLKFAIHNWETLSASVKGMQQHFNVDSINSFCTLPLYHVSGLMQYLRSYLTQGQFITWDWKQLEHNNFPNIELQTFFISLVPTQLQRLLNQSKLKQFKTILLGGAPAWESLLITARTKGLPIALTYGMTETASQVTTLLPHEFLAGQTNVGKPLPHATLQILNPQNQPCAPNEIGQISIQSKSQMFAYLFLFENSFPIGLDTKSDNRSNTESDHSPPEFRPDDLGYLDSQGYLHIIGRTSDKIITGGENIYPAEVEALILATGIVKDVCVMGIPDEVWGQRVVAAYVDFSEYPLASEIMHTLNTTNTTNTTKTPNTTSTNTLKVNVTIESAPNTTPLTKEDWRGSPQQFPKQWIKLPALPRNSQGKIDRLQLLQLLQLLQPSLQPHLQNPKSKIQNPEM